MGQRLQTMFDLSLHSFEAGLLMMYGSSLHLFGTELPMTSGLSLQCFEEVEQAEEALEVKGPPDPAV